MTANWMRHIAMAFVTGLLLAIGGTTANASHITGGDISYQCLGNGQYLITLNLFRDCEGITVGNQQDIVIESSCGVSTTVTLDLVSTGGVEISQLCPNQFPLSACNGGPLPGNELYTYTAITNIPYCNGTYTFSWTSCCRNAAATNIANPGGADLYVETTYNMAADPCDTSPMFENNPSAYPLQYVCQNSAYSYNFGVVDPDADSLVYSLVAASTGPGTGVGYVAPYTATQPINSTVLDPQTGQLTFNPNVQGNFIVTVEVNSYDSVGTWLGTVTRDIQFVVFPCPGQFMPVMANGGINTFTGSANLAGPTQIEMCTGDDFCFGLNISDANTNQTLSVTSNIAQVLPGANMIVTGSNPVQVDVCYTATPSSPSFASFTLVVDDGNCPIPGVITLTVSVEVDVATYAGPDHTICNGAVAPLSAWGGNVFTWSSLSGDSVGVGTNFSCNPCANPVATPSITTEYLVTSDFPGVCGNTDTVIVSVPGDITITANLSEDTVCLNEEVQIDLVPDPPGSYTYAWQPNAQLSNTNSSNVLATMTNPGMNRFYMSLTNPGGCNADDSVDVFVTPSTIPPIAFNGPTSVCSGDTSVVEATFATPPSCVYVLLLEDDFGNGWMNGSVEVWIDSVLQGTYQASGFGGEEWIIVPEGALFQLVYNPDMFNNQVHFSLFDGTGAQIYNSPNNPNGGQVYQGNVNCGSFSYEWTPQLFIDNANTAMASLYPPSPTTYTVHVTNFEGTCSDSVLFTVDIAEPPAISNIFVDDVECLIDSNGVLNVAVNGGLPPYNFSIDNGATFQQGGIITGLPAGQYIVIVEDANTCSTVSDPVSIQPYDTLKVVAGDVLPICATIPTQLNAQATGGIPGVNYSYVWWNASGFQLPGQSPQVTSDTTVMFYVMADDGCNDSTAVDSVELVVYPWPTTEFAVSDSVGCAPQEVKIIYTPSSPLDSAVWHFSTGDTVIGNSTFDYEFASAGVWDVSLEVYSEGGCSMFETLPDAVRIYPVPEAFFYYTPQNPTISNSLVTFSNESVGNIDSVYWNFAGLGWEEQIDDPSFEFPADTGFYDVRLYVRSTDGCESDTILPVYINGEFFFHMPNAFTPNGDGLNDVFVPIGYGLHSSRSAFMIFNRWGELLHISDNPHEGWDGMVNGKVAPNGVYIWKMIAPDPFTRDPEDVREWVGQVTLLH